MAGQLRGENINTRSVLERCMSCKSLAKIYFANKSWRKNHKVSLDEYFA